ncbi:hypothetical protein Tco_1477693, partial [Tanacetum coccineum]
NWVQQVIDVESTSDNDARDQASELETKVLLEGKQDEAKVVKVVVVADEQNSDEVIRVGEDDDSGNAATDGGDDAVERGTYQSAIHLLVREARVLPNCGERLVQWMSKCSLTKGLIKKVQYDVYTLYFLIPFLNSLNDKYIKKNKMKAAMQRRLRIPELRVLFKTSP